MTRRTFQTGLLLAASGSLAFSAAAQGTRGSWSGVLDVGSKRLRLKLEIESDGAARIFSLDQGGQPIAGRSTSGSADQIEIEFPAIHAVFAGRLIGPDRMEGVWRQGSPISNWPSSGVREHWRRWRRLDRLPGSA